MRVIDSNVLCHHSSQRQSHKVRPVYIQKVHQADGVIGHHAHTVWSGGFAAVSTASVVESDYVVMLGEGAHQREQGVLGASESIDYD